VEAAPDIVAEPTTASSPNAPSPASSSTPGGARRKILIGSQRDAADVGLRPAQPQAVRRARTTPVEAAPETTSPVPAEPPTTTPPTAEATGQLPAPEPAAPLEAHDEPVAEMDLTADLDNELEAALKGVSLERLLDATTDAIAELEAESRVKGTVSRVHNENVFFSLKGRFEGVTSLRHFKKPPAIGAMMDVIVVSLNAEEGLYELTIPGASVDVADWSDLAEGAVVEARITGSNTGGLECLVNSIRGFIPASQIDLFRVEHFGDYVNRRLTCVVTEANPRRKRLVLSHRAIVEREREASRQQLIEALEVGQVCEGVVTRLMDFGAFVDIGGIEGLAHISKLSWSHVAHPKDVVEVGQRIRVKIEKINKAAGKISLSHRDTLDHPWHNVEQRFPANSVVKGTVSRIAQFGAFVRLDHGVEGLVHISELAHHHVNSVKNVVNEGDVIEVKVLAVDAANQKIALSLKATLQPPEPAAAKAAESAEAEPARPLSVPRRNVPLKGGRDRHDDGEHFGLRL